VPTQFSNTLFGVSQRKAKESRKKSNRKYTFVSLLSSDGMTLEDLADLVGHKGTLTTDTVYRKVIVPERPRGAEVQCTACRVRAR
jgi:hypothetical protein